MGNFMKKLKLNFFAALFSALFLASSPLQAGPSNEMIIEVESPLGFDATISKLKTNAKGLGWKVPKKWAKNFQKNLKHVTKIDIGKNLVIEMCEPYAAVALLVHDKYKKFLAMMPCSVAVYQKSDGKTYISMMNLRLVGTMFQGKEIEDLVTKLAPQMDQMLVMQ